MEVQVCIPHYFAETEDTSGYGSCRQGNQLPRAIALSRCLSGLINLRRTTHDFELNIGERSIETLPAIEGATWIDRELHIEITVCITADRCLQDVLQLYDRHVRVVRLDPDHPRELPLAARDHLIQERPQADLAVYLEDDLIIGDPLYFDKLFWFHTHTKHAMCLMPHRYEPRTAPNRGRLLVDGALAETFISRFASPKKDIAKGRFQGREISFDLSDNPHSGSFCLSAPQVQALKRQVLPRSGFVGPLETAATLTVLQFFPVLKTARKSRDFLAIEHGHPSFLGYFNSLPLRP